MPERVVLHIGTHKTGSTSIQQFLHDENDGLLADVGARYPETGWFRDRHQPELPIVALHPRRLTPIAWRFPRTLDPSWIAEAAQRVRDTAAACPQPTLVYSHESLSWLRADDEFDRLRSVLPDADVTVVVYLRDKAEFLRSYTAQYANLVERLGAQRGTFLDVATDSWLLDYDSLLAAYRRHFGRVEVVDYDEAVRADGSVLPSFASLLGIDPHALPELDRYFLRRSNAG